MIKNERQRDRVSRVNLASIIYEQHMPRTSEFQPHHYQHRVNLLSCNDCVAAHYRCETQCLRHLISNLTTN